MSGRRATVPSVSPAAFKSAYLIHGDDHGRIAERRSRLRALAESQSGSSGVEVLEGDACTPDAVAGALSAMTFAMGRRFVIADGVAEGSDLLRQIRDDVESLGRRVGHYLLWIDLH